MDVHQVNSRVFHDDPPPEDFLTEDNHNHHDDSDTDANGGAIARAVTAADDKRGEKAGDLEKMATAASRASYEESFPEGGAKAWLVVFGSFFALMSSMGLMNSVAIFQAYTLSHQLKDYKEGTVGWIFSIYTFLAFFCGVYIGPVFDKYGPRWLIIAGALCTVTGVIGMSFAYKLWHFILSFGILAGFGTSLLFTPCIAAVGHWFKRRRGFATGIASSAGGFGGIIFPLMLTSLFDNEKVGYAWATRILALICICCSCVGMLLVRSRLPPAANATAHPDFRILRQMPFLFTTIGIFLLEFSLFIPLAYISTYAINQGFKETFAYHLIPIMNAGSVVGRALPGYYSDIIGPFNTCLFSVILSLVACLCVWLPSGHTTPGIIIFSVMFGFASGTSIAIAPVCIGRLCKTQEYGRYYATTYTVVSFACLIGIPIAGSIVSASHGSYTGLIIVTGVVYVASAFFLMLAKTWDIGWKQWLAVY